MRSSILSLPEKTAGNLDQYAITASTAITPILQSHHAWTQANFSDADRSSSLLQAQWMLQRAFERRARRVLDIGCYTGLSALAWYEGTKETQAQIFTIEYDRKIAETAREVFQRLGCQDRVQVVEGDANNVLDELTDPFDIIFVDLEFSAYQPIVQKILDRKLLAQNGIILVDNVFARGFVVDERNLANIDPSKIEHWTQSGRLVKDFNAFLQGDTRISVTLLPFFDGISEIRWKT